MPRCVREPSISGIYHVILRGNNRQILFESAYDYQEFLDLLMVFKEEYEYEIYAYCLMNNHVHLCIKIKLEDLSILMKRLEIKFVRWYNQKYKRCGHLFQERFKSEPVDSEAYLLTLFRYIHQNPTHAFLEQKPGSYKWSSYYAYATENNQLVNTRILRRFFATHQEMMDFLDNVVDDQCMEYYSLKRIPDEIAREIILSMTGIYSLQEFAQLPLFQRNEYIKKLRKKGISSRQMNRLTGISRKIIEKIWRQ